MARLGFAVTGADASDKNIGTPSPMPLSPGLAIDYRATSAELLVEEGLTFDVVLNMEVVEHVADVQAYLAACAALVKPAGLTFVATLNKTLKSLALAKIGAEYVSIGCRAAPMTGTALFRPQSLRQYLKKTGLTVLKMQGFPLIRWAGTGVVVRCRRKLHAQAAIAEAGSRRRAQFTPSRSGGSGATSTPSSCSSCASLWVASP